jgi:hypothetical protein
VTVRMTRLGRASPQMGNWLCHRVVAAIVTRQTGTLSLVLSPSESARVVPVISAQRSNRFLSFAYESLPGMRCGRWGGRGTWLWSAWLPC